jgi:hypothetical protein
MGVGNRTIAVAWRALHFTTAAGSSTITLDMTQDQIKATPDYRRPGTPAAPPVTVAAPPSAPSPVPSAVPPPAAGTTSQ